MSEPPDAYYTDARWQNWLDRVREQDLDPEEEDDGALAAGCRLAGRSNGTSRRGRYGLVWARITSRPTSRTGLSVLSPEVDELWDNYK